MALLGAMQPEQRYQVALLERITAPAFDSSAIRQLSTCYLHALEGYNLLELHKLIGVQDLARLRAMDFLDSAGRGDVIAGRFLASPWTKIEASRNRTRDKTTWSTSANNLSRLEAAPHASPECPDRA